MPKPDLRPAAIVFDVDGTLYDPARLKRMMLRRLLAAYGRRPGELFRTFRMLSSWRRALEKMRSNELGADPREQLRIAAGLSGISESEVGSCVSCWFEQVPLALLNQCVRPGLREFLAEASRSGVRLGVLSDYAAVSKLRALELDGWFEAVVSAQDTGCLKPNPRGLSIILNQLGTDAERAVYIGDIPAIDAETALRAGAKAVIIGRRGSRSVRWTGIRNYGEGRRLLLAP